MGIIKEDAFTDVAEENFKEILNNLGDYDTPTVKYFLNLYAGGKSLEDLNPKTDFVIINKIFGTPRLKERIDNILNEVLTEKLCPKGEAYRQRRLASGEKSSAYLSGRAVKVCKGLMSGKKK